MNILVGCSALLRYAWTVEIAIKSCFVTDNDEQKVRAVAFA